MSSIDIRNLSWQQVAICSVLLVAVIGAYKLFGELPAGVLLVVSSITNLMLGRAPADPNKDGEK